MDFDSIGAITILVRTLQVLMPLQYHTIGLIVPLGLCRFERVVLLYFTARKESLKLSKNSSLSVDVIISL